MGTIKDSKKADKKYSLSKFELNFFKALVVNRNAAFNQYQGAIQGFLTYLAGEKWGIPDPENFDFEVDSETESVKITKKKK